jgi:hypothetical protein
VDLLRGYVTGTVQALHAEGLLVDRTWLDPRDPRDATIVLDSQALVWDESTGWRHGRFVSGRQGVRTVLEGEAHLGGGLLPDPRTLAGALNSNRPVTPPYRHPETRDGLDEALREWRLP